MKKSRDWFFTTLAIILIFYGSFRFGFSDTWLEFFKGLVFMAVGIASLIQDRNS